MVRDLCSNCAKSFASVGKPCSFHSGATTGHKAASGRYSNPTEQESQKECSTSSGSNDPLLPFEVHMVEPQTHDRKRGVAEDQKCDRQSECALPDTYLENSIDVNTLEASAEKSSSILHLPRNRNNSSDDNYYEGYDVRKKAELDQEVQSSVTSQINILKGKLYKKRLQECGKGNSKGSITYPLECSLPNAYVESSINVATLEDSENSSQLSERESVTSSVDSLAAPGPSGITKKTNESNISAIASQFKLFKGESTTSSVDSLATPGPSGITKKTNKSNIIAKTSQSKLSEGGSITSSVDSFAAPGPSGITNKINESKISAKTSQSKSSFEDQSVVEDKSKSICKKCKKEISDHVVIIHERRLYKCCACNYRNANKLNLERHDYYSACRERHCYACTVCDELTWNTRNHGTKKLCGICGRSFSCVTQLENHTLCHEKKFKYCCRVCGNKISEHITSDGKEFYKCCKCDYKGYKSGLRKHLFIHTDLRLFKCDLCDKRFMYKSSLVTHLRSHFKFKKCGETFPSDKSLDKHDKKDHN